MTVLGKFMKAILLTIALSLSANAYGLCDLKEERRPNGGDINYRIDFPDGRWIIVAGHNHGEREIWKEVYGLPVDAPNYLDQVRKILSTYPRQAREHFREDLLLARRAVSQNAGFLGVETTPEDVPEFRKLFRNVRSRILHEAGRRGQNGNELLEEMGMVMLGVPMYLANMQPETLGRTEVVGMEGGHFKDQDGPWAERLSEVTKRIAVQASKNPSPLNLQKVDEHMGMKMYMKFRPGDHSFHSEVETYLKSQFPFSLHQEIENYIDTWMGYWAAIRARDEWVANQLFDRNQSGIHFVGSIHAGAIAHKLREYCTGSVPRLPLRHEEGPITGSASIR